MNYENTLKELVAFVRNKMLAEAYHLKMAQKERQAIWDKLDAMNNRVKNDTDKQPH